MGQFSKLCSEMIYRLIDWRVVCKFLGIRPTGN